MSKSYKAEVINSSVVVTPGAAAVIADSGQLPAGRYDVEVTLAYADAAAAGKDLQIQHRNAANAANINTLGGTVAGCSDFIFLYEYVIQTNERIRVVTGGQVGAANSEAFAMVRVRQLA